MTFDAWQEVVATLARNKLRTLLTACGVFWGIFMLILMLGLGTGLHRGTQNKLGGIVTRSVFVWSQRTSMPYRGLQPGRHLRFRNDDIEAVARVPGVEHVAPRLRLGGWRNGGWRAELWWSTFPITNSPYVRFPGSRRFAGVGSGTWFGSFRAARSESELPGFLESARHAGFQVTL